MSSHYILGALEVQELRSEFRSIMVEHLDETLEMKLSLEQGRVVASDLCELNNLDIDTYLGGSLTHSQLVEMLLPGVLSDRLAHRSCAHYLLREFGEELPIYFHLWQVPEGELDHSFSRSRYGQILVDGHSIIYTQSNGHRWLGDGLSTYFEDDIGMYVTEIFEVPEQIIVEYVEHLASYWTNMQFQFETPDEYDSDYEYDYEYERYRE